MQTQFVVTIQHAEGEVPTEKVERALSAATAAPCYLSSITYEGEVALITNIRVERVYGKL